MSQRIAVIGGGAAGMMAAFSAASAGASVTVFERGHSPGAKILLTGGGRCNFTRESEPRDFVHDLGKRGRFMGHALAALPPSTTRKMFAGLGVPSIVEPDGRVVPVSQRAVDVRRALVDALASAGVRMVAGADVTAAAPCSDGWRLECSTPQTGFDSVIIAAGGMSCPVTGSDGAGFRLARALGHAVRQPVPAEVPLITAGFPIERLQGLTVENVTLAIAGDRASRRRGNLLFTHFGISGPGVLDISGDVAEAVERGKAVTLLVDIAPDANDDEIMDALAYGVDGLRRLMPSRLAAVVADIAAGAPGEVWPVRKLPLRIVRTRGFEYSMVTRGGVDLHEVDPATMQSRLVPGLYFAGEVLDLDGPMGGYNLQIAWSTGWLAGMSAARPGGTAARV